MVLEWCWLGVWLVEGVGGSGEVAGAECVGGVSCSGGGVGSGRVQGGSVVG